MGAYRRGDVAELCELVHPRIGVLTAIGPAHLERFGSLDAIEQAKGELAEGCPPTAPSSRRADDERCLRTTERTQARVVLFSAAGARTRDVTGRATSRWREGTTRFTLRHGDEDGHRPLQAARPAQRREPARRRGGGDRASTSRSTRSPGRSARVTPPAHRLAPILNRQAGIVVIDDAYNSNPVGAAAALEVLAVARGASAGCS